MQKSSIVWISGGGQLSLKSGLQHIAFLNPKKPP